MSGIKERLAFILGMVRRIFHFGFIPTVLYLGFSQGTEDETAPLNLFSLFF